MNGLYWSWAAIAGVAALSLLVALRERRSGKSDPSPGPVHYGHCNVDDHEYEDLEPRHRDNEANP